MSRSGFLRLGLALVVVLGLVAGAIVLFGGGKGQASSGSPNPDSEDADEVAIPVKTVHPRLDPKFSMTASRPADIQAYYWMDVESRVPGVVKRIQKTVNDRVKSTEEIITLDVPDLDATVIEKQNLVNEREQDIEVAQREVKAAEAAVKTAEADVPVKKALVKQAQATMDYKAKYVVRMQGLYARNTIDRGVLEEAERDYDSSVAGKAAAVAAVEKAKETVKDAEAKRDAAVARVKLCEALKRKALSEQEYARAMQQFAHIKIPPEYDGEYDNGPRSGGVIVRRHVDPGTFVQNASNGQRGTPILSIVRDDIVTVVMRLPDKYAPYITNGTEAIVELDSLPGLKIKGTVTRFSPSLANEQNDRTMRVEVELWNRSLEAFKKFEAKELEGTLLPGARPGAKPVPFGDLKSGSFDPKTKNLRISVPKYEGKVSSGMSARLMPGMYGTMTLVLRTFSNTHLLPSAAIVHKGGNSFIYLVDKGRVREQPVEVKVDDGKLVKVDLLGKDGTVTGELRGDEEVIVSNQGELSEDQLVKPALTEGWTKETFADKDARH